MIVVVVVVTVKCTMNLASLAVSVFTAFDPVVDQL